MRSRHVNALALWSAVLVAGGCATRPAIIPPDVPAQLRAPAGQSVFLEALATGVQIYECAAKRDQPSVFEWVFRAPEAALADRSGHSIGKHYAGPTWESVDGSTVVGEVKSRVRARMRLRFQLGRLAGLEMYGTCSSRVAPAVAELGGIPIDYQHQDFVKEIHRLTSEGVDAVFDPIGGAHLWHSREALRPGGRVVGYGNTTSLRGEGLGAGRTGRRNRLHGIPIYAMYIAGGWLLPGRKRIVPYSIQTLKRLKPALFRQDLIALFELLRQQKIKPLIAQRFPLAEARRAQELLGKGGVIGKIVLVRNGSSLGAGAA
ncbi:MAG: zinc-binding dehydrogenase [Bradyrhizobium sp.]